MYDISITTMIYYVICIITHCIYMQRTICRPRHIISMFGITILSCHNNITRTIFPMIKRKPTVWKYLIIRQNRIFITIILYCTRFFMGIFCATSTIMINNIICFGRPFCSKGKSPRIRGTRLISQRYRLTRCYTCVFANKTRIQSTGFI